MSDWPGVVEDQWPGVEVVSTGEDVARAARAGAVTGAAGVPGFFGDAATAFNKVGTGLAQWYGKHLGVDPEALKSLKVEGSPVLPTTQDIKQGTGLDKYDYEPQSTPGKFAKSIAEFTPGALTGGVGSARQVASNVARYGVLPGAAAEAAGEATEGTKLEPWARGAAAIASGALAPRAVSPFANRAPEATREAYAHQVAVLEREGVPVTAGQRGDSQGLKYLENNLNPDQVKDMQEGFTRAATRTAGIETPVLQHGAGGTVATLRKEVGSRFDALASGNTLHADAKMATELMDLRNEYTAVPGAYDDAAVKALHGAANHVSDLMKANGGAMLTGEQYQRLRSNLNKAAMSAEGQKATALHDFVDTLDNAMERSIARTNPADAGLFPKARDDYKRALTLEKAASAAGESSARGYITPAQLSRAAKGVYGNRAFETGKTPFSDLATAGAAVLKALPDSGTSHRMWVDSMFKVPAHIIGGGGGFLAGTHSGIGEGAIGGLLLGEGAAPFIEHGLRAGARHVVDTLHPYLGNQIAAGAPRLRENLPGLLTIANAARQ